MKHYYNVINCKMVSNLIVSFDIRVLDSDALYISTVMIKIVDAKGYYLHYFDIDQLKVYTISIKEGFDITDTDIPVDIDVQLPGSGT